MPSEGLSLRRRLGTGFFYGGIAMAFNGGSTFLVNVAAANFLGRAVFGEFTVVLTTLLTISSLAPLGVGLTATKYVAELRSADPPRIGRILGLCSMVSGLAGLVSAVALAAASPAFASSVLKNSALAPGLAIVSVAVFFNVASAYRSGALAGFENYAGVAKAAAFAGTSYVLFCVAGAWFGGRDGALIGLAASAAVQWWALRSFLRAECVRRKVEVRHDGYRAERSVLLHFSLPAALSGLSAMPALWIGSILVARENHGYEQMALFGAAATLRVLILFVPQLVNGVALSILNNVRGRGDRPAFLRLVRMNVLATAVLGAVAASAVAFAGRWLLSLFGPQFAEGYAVLLILIGAALAESLTLAVCQVLQAEVRMWSWALGVTVPRDLMIVILAFELCPRFGAAGLAWAYTLGWTMALFTTTALAVRAVRLPLMPDAAAAGVGGLALK
jgi:O-antigen/teichoic acid export membrane protein